jgi:hypothetical protein
MSAKDWIRNAKKVHEDLVKQPNGSVITARGCVIHIPERFLEKGLAVLGQEVLMTGIYAICVADKYYGVSTLNANLKIKPSKIVTVKIDDVSYLEFSFDPGSVVFVESQIVRTDTLVYRIFDEIIAKGRVPWYLDYNDLAKLFETSTEFAGVNLGRTHAILEMIAAAVSRSSTDRTQYYRQAVKSQQDVKDHPPVVIPLRSVTYGASNTTAKLMGSYWNDGVTAALVNPADKVEKIEELLRR